MKDVIYCESCLDTMKRLIDCGDKVDIILTSPPYGNSTSVGDKRKQDDLNDSKHGSHVRYDEYNDDISVDEYYSFIKNVFINFDKILTEGGVILYNFSYSTQNVERTKMYWDILNMINNETNFIIVDQISWKKRCALPIHAHNKLSRLCENVFVIARKTEYYTFKANKKVSKVVNNVNFYDYVVNFIEAPNNDGCQSLNKACFSTELVLKLLKLYCYSKDLIVYDPFMGTGTTANACIIYGCHYLGSELSKKQCDYAIKRLEKHINVDDW